MKTKVMRGVLAVAVGLAAMAMAPAKDVALKGKLLIMGGGISKHADAIYAKLIAAVPEGGTIGVVPTASELEDSGEVSVKRISGYAGPGRKVVEIPVKAKDGPGKADEAAVAELIGKCDGVFFVGGAQSRVVNAFYPGGKATKGSEALEGVLAKGGILSGSSAGAAIMSDPMIYGGTSNRALSPAAATQPLDEDERGGSGAVPMGKGMGYFPFGTVDQHFLERGRLGRLIVAMEQQGQMLAWGIPEDRAILVDRATGKMEVIGDTGLVQVSRKGANGREGIRLSILSNGDVVDAKSGEVVTERPTMEVKGSKEGQRLKGPWLKRRVNEMVKELSEGAKSVAAADDNWELVLSRDSETKFYGEGDAMTVVGVKLDLVKVK